VGNPAGRPRRHGLVATTRTAPIRAVVARDRAIVDPLTLAAALPVAAGGSPPATRRPTARLSA